MTLTKHLGGEPAGTKKNLRTIGNGLVALRHSGSEQDTAAAEEHPDGWGILATMNTVIRIDAQSSKHAGCGGILIMSEDAPSYSITLGGLETVIPGVEMKCSKCGRGIRAQEEVEVTEAN